MDERGASPEFQKDRDDYERTQAQRWAKYAAKPEPVYPTCSCDHCRAAWAKPAGLTDKAQREAHLGRVRKSEAVQAAIRRSRASYRQSLP